MKTLGQWIFFVCISLAMGLSSFEPVMGAPAEQVRVWVEFAPGKSGEVRASLAGVGAEFHYTFDELSSFVVSVPQNALNGLVRNPNVVSIEDDVLRYAMGDTVIGGQTFPYGLYNTQAVEVWDANGDGNVDGGAPTGAGRTVCIIDSGFYVGHEDLSGLTVSGVSQVGSSWQTDGYGHGTHVAGTIAAMNNGQGVVGVSPGGVSLFIVKIFNDEGLWTRSSNLVDALNSCRNAGANVVNMSLGGGRPSSREEAAFNNAYAAGVLSIASAGNDGTTALNYPASYSSVVSVAATDVNNTVADFSQKNAAVELAAPGVAVLSTVPYVSTNKITVMGVDYSGGQIEFAALGTATGALANGGFCSVTSSLWSGKVVLCERGEVSFYDKVRNVQLSGGAAAVIFNNVPGGFLGTLGEGNSSTIPAISLSQEDGQFLRDNRLGLSSTVASTLTKPASGYEAWDGTSMAAPHVSGIAALIWSANTSWTNAQVRTALQQTAMDLGTPNKDDSYGYGLVQAKAALAALQGGGGGGGGTLVVGVGANKSEYVNRETVTITVNVTAGGSPVSGAAVRVEITGAKGSATVVNATTNASGVATVSYKINTAKTGTGLYTVNASASKEGFTGGSSSTTFTVR